MEFIETKMDTRCEGNVILDALIKGTKNHSRRTLSILASTDYNNNGMNEAGFKAVIVAALLRTFEDYTDVYFDIISEEKLLHKEDKYVKGYIDLLVIWRDANNLENKLIIELKYIQAPFIKEYHNKHDVLPYATPKRSLDFKEQDKQRKKLTEISKEFSNTSEHELRKKSFFEVYAAHTKFPTVADKEESATKQVIDYVSHMSLKEDEKIYAVVIIGVVSNVIIKRVL